jgi:hypothetical protein
MVLLRNSLKRAGRHGQRKHGYSRNVPGESQAKVARVVSSNFHIISEIQDDGSSE